MVRVLAGIGESAEEVISHGRFEMRFGLDRIEPRCLPPSFDGLHDLFAARGASLPHDKKIVVYCGDANCAESARVIEALGRKGFTDLVRLDGGWAAWAGAGYPAQRGFGQP